jgi:hypothetical protein
MSLHCLYLYCVNFRLNPLIFVSERTGLFAVDHILEVFLYLVQKEVRYFSSIF